MLIAELSRPEAIPIRQNTIQNSQPASRGKYIECGWYFFIEHSRLRHASLTMLAYRGGLGSWKKNQASLHGPSRTP
jgi:hypothetical protein